MNTRKIKQEIKQVEAQKNKASKKLKTTLFELEREKGKLKEVITKEIETNPDSINSLSNNINVLLKEAKESGDEEEFNKLTRIKELISSEIVKYRFENEISKPGEWTDAPPGTKIDDIEVVKINIMVCTIGKVTNDSMRVLMGLIHEQPGAALFNTWWLWGLIELINNQSAVMISEHRDRKFQKQYKDLTQRIFRRKETPQPFCRVKLHRPIKSIDIQEGFKKLPRVYVPPSYRWDARAHYRLRVKRGKLPISDRDRKWCEDRKYKLYEDRIDSETYKLLEMRPHIKPKLPDEWMAVKVTWVDSFVNGPKDAEYIPTIREIE